MGSREMRLGCGVELKYRNLRYGQNLLILIVLILFQTLTLDVLAQEKIPEESAYVFYVRNPILLDPKTPKDTPNTITQGKDDDATKLNTVILRNEATQLWLTVKDGVVVGSTKDPAQAGHFVIYKTTKPDPDNPASMDKTLHNGDYIKVRTTQGNLWIELSGDKVLAQGTLRDKASELFINKVTPQRVDAPDSLKDTIHDGDLLVIRGKRSPQGDPWLQSAGNTIVARALTPRVDPQVSGNSAELGSFDLVFAPCTRGLKLGKHRAYVYADAPNIAGITNEAVLAQVSPAVLSAVDADHACMSDDCSDREAIIFVHGIYGSRETFRNATTNFDWPSQFPTTVAGRRIDVFVLDYRTVLLGWARGSQPDFRQIDEAVFAAMKPLRTRNYRSIGIIAHSLGGNVASSYVHAVKTALSHPARAQHAFVITLATPVLGSQVADLGSMLKSVLGMSDPLLSSLKEDNLFLSMLQSYRIREGPKGEAYRCRPVHLHVAFEQQRMGPFLIVSESSAVDEVRSIAVPPIRGFERDHSGIAKPSGPTDEVFQWILTIVNAEYLRLAIWEQAHQDFPPERRLCELIPRFPE